MTEFFAEVWAWLADPANWTGRDGMPNRLWEHVAVSAVALGIAGIVAVPAGVLLGHRGRGGVIAVAAVNIGRAVPSFGIVGLAFPVTLALGLRPLGYWATLVALVALALPPLFVTSYTGLRQVDPALVEAGRGMGMVGRQVLTGIELPLALPLIMAGVRTAGVEVVATATLGAVVGFGGLGRYIIDGFAQRNYPEVFVGGSAVAILAIFTEWALGWIERRSDRSHRPSEGAPEAVEPLDVGNVTPVG